MSDQITLKTMVLMVAALGASGCAQLAPKGPTGCCQVSEGSCASPVSEAQCEELGGRAFHEGGTCRQSSGVCGVLQDN